MTAHRIHTAGRWRRIGAAIATTIAFAAALHFMDKVLAGFGQCAAAQTCPWEPR